MENIFNTHTEIISEFNLEIPPTKIYNQKIKNIRISKHKIKVKSKVRTSYYLLAFQDSKTNKIDIVNKTAQSTKINPTTFNNINEDYIHSEELLEEAYIRAFETKYDFQKISKPDISDFNFEELLNQKSPYDDLACIRLKKGLFTSTATIEESLFRILSVDKAVEEISVNWLDVDFYNGFIILRIRNSTCRIDLADSLKGFNDLKYLLINGGFESPKATVYAFDNRIYQLQMPFKFIEVFDFLRINLALTNDDLEIYEQSISLISTWDNDRIGRSFRLLDKSRYINYLCRVCTNNKAKIVPVREVRTFDSNNSVVVENAFLATIRRSHRVYIIWENESEDRASFVFRCKPGNYSEAMQMVFDYVASKDITNKREKLHSVRSRYFKNSIVHYVGSINHIYNDFDVWEKHLKSITA